jgi:maltose alpha-D-glucosyltransferase/alpha-amylase
LHPTNHTVLAFVRRHEEERLLVVANLSRFVQSVELDLRPYGGLVPVELFGRTPFRPIGDEPYALTLGPHAFYWFVLQPEQDTLAGSREAGAPVLEVDDSWEELLGAATGALEVILPAHLQSSPWFAGMGRRVLAVRILEVVAVPHETTQSYATFLRVDYADGEPETYLLPLAFTAHDHTQRWDDPAEALVAEVRRTDVLAVEGVLIDATRTSDLPTALLNAIAGGDNPLRGVAGEIVATRTPAFSQVGVPVPTELRPVIAEVEQNHTSVVYSERLVLKLFRRLEAGIHPEVEIGRMLTEQGFPHTPPFIGTLAYHPGRGEPTTLAVLHGYVPNQGDAWQHALAAVRRYYERVQADSTTPTPQVPNAHTLLELVERDLQTEVEELLGPFLGLVRLLGRRTAELHGALAADEADPAFVPEPLTSFTQRSMYQAMRGLTGRVFRSLRHERDRLPEPLQQEAEELLGREEELLGRFRQVVRRRLVATTIRCHGDYHLGQVLVAGDDVAIIDFEGEPSCPLAERRLKRPPLRDVASMLRSFAYAADTGQWDHSEDGMERGEVARPELEPSARSWQLWTSAAFLREYLDAVDPQLIPPSREDLAVLLDVFLLEKAVYQLGHELRTRPAWVGIPLRGLGHLLAAPDPAQRRFDA